MDGSKASEVIRRALQDWRFHAVFWVGSVAAVSLKGHAAALGLALGILGTFASIFGTWAAVRLMAKGAEIGGKPSFGGLVLGFVFLIKLPVFLFCVWIASKLPDPGLPSFGIGVVLVYCSLVAWAQVKA